MELDSPEERIAYLEARLARLEAALEARSRELRKLQRYMSGVDLLLLSRILSGLPPLPQRAYEPSLWSETTELERADVEESLQDLWRSLRPIEDPPDSDGTA
jgi:hypothetical protein